MIQQLQQKIRDFSTPEPNTGCWLWERATSDKGYGSMRWDGRTRSAHRMSHIAFIGSIPDGLHVCHRCDQPSCVNPVHLWLGTNDDNMADRDTKGRVAKGDQSGARRHPERMVYVRGEKIGCAKLTAADVVEIRRALAKGHSYNAIGRTYGVGPSAIRSIALGLHWRHV
jgi:hypothetical protein